MDVSSDTHGHFTTVTNKPATLDPEEGETFSQSRKKYNQTESLYVWPRKRRRLPHQNGTFEDFCFRQIRYLDPTF